MTAIKALAVSLVILSAPAVAQNVYRCEGNIYQAKPCEGEGKETDIPLTGYPVGTSPYPAGYIFFPPTEQKGVSVLKPHHDHYGYGAGRRYWTRPDYRFDYRR